jgi:hypothetical protein
LERSAFDKLQHLKQLLSHQVPSGELAQVLERAFDVAIRQLEKGRFASTDRPRPSRLSADPRYVPAAVRRTVLERDGGQCTFVSDEGHRCPATSRLEFDHIDPVARGGLASIANIRLRCRAHNQFEAERTFGDSFMDEKRREAVAARAREGTSRAHRTHPRARAATAASAAVREVIPYLRELGFSVEEARRAAATSEDMPSAPLEERVRAALAHHGKRLLLRSARAV